MKIAKNLPGKKVELTFLDHSSDTSATVPMNPEPVRTTITIMGRVLAGDQDYYLVETANCNLPGNSETWSVLKSAVIDCKEVRYE